MATASSHLSSSRVMRSLQQQTKLGTIFRSCHQPANDFSGRDVCTLRHPALLEWPPSLLAAVPLVNHCLPIVVSADFSRRWRPSRQPLFCLYCLSAHRCFSAVHRNHTVGINACWRFLVTIGNGESSRTPANQILDSLLTSMAASSCSLLELLQGHEVALECQVLPAQL